MDQNRGPHNGGCDVCTGLITVHNGDDRHGEVDYAIEYYSTGHLTKFVKPGAVRIESDDDTSVRNVAWRNPDGSKALIAFNTTDATQNVVVNWAGQSFAYDLPANTTATFTWGGAAAHPVSAGGARLLRCRPARPGGTVAVGRPEQDCERVPGGESPAPVLAVHIGTRAARSPIRTKLLSRRCCR
ncbi:glycosyl hydrolase family 30 [Saccharopolyspora shandongensis]|uniref:Glycosyl hydrolase family 30 n=1 Tax=Saccharopolyspora shandongensis TaxID=418495 RepID=A0A1H3KUZ4_9PSEU|nr:glycoside hydrolase family 30 beta sandwich domain-containing protein [Saccharopolyspora shandongensis]SDY55992.1 glycosyl hydrolase family 30 [Saccharopolyspora shandongensis]